MMSTLTVLVFRLPSDSGEKISLGVTVLLGFTVFMMSIADKMPEISQSMTLIGEFDTTKKLSTYLTVSLELFFKSLYRIVHGDSNGLDLCFSDHVSDCAQTIPQRYRHDTTTRLDSKVRIFIHVMGKLMHR